MLNHGHYRCAHVLLSQERTLFDTSSQPNLLALLPWRLLVRLPCADAYWRQVAAKSALRLQRYVR